MPRSSSSHRRGISKAGGHLFYTSQNSGYMLENERRIDETRAQFRENKLSYKYPHDPILGIKTEDAAYLVKLVEKDTDLGIDHDCKYYINQIYNI